MNCERLVEHDHMISTKDDEISRLKARIRELELKPPVRVVNSPTPDPSASATSLPAGAVRSEPTTHAKTIL
jgi:hypothetical protein